MTSSAHVRPLLAWLAWLLPPAVLLTIFHPGLWTWFHTDDFSLLWLVTLSGDEFWLRLLEPRAQGTYRPLSERLFFYLLYQEFGWNAFPYRIVVFATQIVNLWLLTALLKRLGASLWVGSFAAALWATHIGLAAPMGWTSAYNQVLCAFFILAALLSFVRFADTARLRWYLLQWALFLAGFGALETIAAYPALVLAYCVLFRRDRWLWPLPMFLGSAAMVWLQLSFAKSGGGEVYRISTAPLELFDTLLYFIGLGIGGSLGLEAGWLMAALSLAAAVWLWSQGESLALFGWAWFVVSLAPYLPLVEHRSDYYLAIPAAGLATAMAASAAAAWRAGAAPRIAAAALLGAFLWGGITVSLISIEYNWRVGIRARNLVTGLAHVRAEHPDKTILLTAVDDELFYTAMYHDLLQIAGLYEVYLAPDANSVAARPGHRPPDRFILDPEDVRLEIARDQIAVYDATGFRLREVTNRYKKLAPLRLGREQ